MNNCKYKSSPQPSVTAMMPNSKYCFFPLLPQIIRMPRMMTVTRYTMSNNVSKIACIDQFLLMCS